MPVRNGCGASEFTVVPGLGAYLCLSRRWGVGRQAGEGPSGEDSFQEKAL